MKKSEAAEALEEFCRNPWEFQQTFETPLKNLQPFVKAIVSSGEGLQTASLIIDQVVFEPRALIQMFEKYSVPLTYDHGVCLSPEGQHEVEELLGSVLSEWIDFLFLPGMQSFAIYADHDEYTTFYSRARTGIDRLAVLLSDHGFKRVPNYERRFRQQGSA